MVDEEDAVEMVDFVEEGAGEGVLGFDADFAAIGEVGFNFYFGGARDEAVNEGNREATFVVGGGFTFGLDNFGVDEGGEGVVFFVFKVVTDDDDAAVDSELRGGHGGGELVGVRLFPEKGSIDHVGDELLETGVVKIFYFSRTSAKAGVGGSDNIAGSDVA